MCDSPGKQLMNFIVKQGLIVADPLDLDWCSHPTATWSWWNEPDAEVKINEWLYVNGEAIMRRIWRDKARLEQQIQNPMASLYKPTGEH